MSSPPYRTIVCVDGFNFYSGVGRGTRWEGLGPVSLFKRPLGPQNTLLKVKYFTARVRSSFNPDMHVRQDAYLRRRMPTIAPLSSPTLA